MDGADGAVWDGMDAKSMSASPSNPEAAVAEPTRPLDVCGKYFETGQPGNAARRISDRFVKAILDDCYTRGLVAERDAQASAEFENYVIDWILLSLACAAHQDVPGGLDDFPPSHFAAELSGAEIDRLLEQLLQSYLAEISFEEPDRLRLTELLEGAAHALRACDCAGTLNRCEGASEGP